MFNSISEIVAANDAAGHHYFKPDTLRFFNGRVLAALYGGRYFITSERDRPFPRAYSVREALSNGTIVGASGFQAFDTAAQARAFAKRLAEANLPFSEYDTVAWDKDEEGEQTGTVSHYAEVNGILVVVVNTGTVGVTQSIYNLHPAMLEIVHKHGDSS